MNLGAVEALLPEQFIRISHSIIINSMWLTKFSGVQNKFWLLRKENEEMVFLIEKQISFLNIIV
jgi:DNA-binding LytR/AlgR family response regulator